MGRYFIYYLILVTSICIILEFTQQLIKTGESISWIPSELSLGFDNESSLLVVPENFNSQENDQLTMITTEPHRTPEESVGDLVLHMTETQSKLDLYCVEKAIYDCFEFFVRYPRLSQKVKKIFIVFPDKLTQKFVKTQLVEEFQSSSYGGEKNRIEKWATWLHNLYFETTHSYPVFDSSNKLEYLKQKQNTLIQLSSKLEFI